VPHYEFNHEKFKVPAGFLIDKAGWKGKNFGAYGVHKVQALVLVNYGEATGSQIFELAQRIQSSVKLKYLVGLELEVNII
jgi:UDP-N-acetylmuramate dehydrogenase